MPSWKVHRRMAKSFGIDLDEETMRRVDRMLDFPEALGLRLKHKAVHNWLGVLEAYSKHGSRGAEYAALHIWLDGYLKGKAGKLVELLLKLQERKRP